MSKNEAKLGAAILAAHALLVVCRELGLDHNMIIQLAASALPPAAAESQPASKEGGR